jgi:hypothetical protein
MTSVQVRQELVDALRLDLVGPDPTRNLGIPDEILPQSPSRWYLTGFLVPLEAGESQRAEETSTDELDEVSDAHGTDDATPPEPRAAKVAYMPSSIGLSVLVPAAAQELRVIVRWGEYRLLETEAEQTGPIQWQRTAREEQVNLPLPERTPQPVETIVPNSRGLRVVLSVRPVPRRPCEGR